MLHVAIEESLRDLETVLGYLFTFIFVLTFPKWNKGCDIICKDEFELISMKGTSLMCVYPTVSTWISLDILFGFVVHPRMILEIYW